MVLNFAILLFQQHQGCSYWLTVLISICDFWIILSLILSVILGISCFILLWRHLDSLRFYIFISFIMLFSQDNESVELSCQSSADAGKSGSNEVHRFELLRSELMELEKRVQRSTAYSENEEVIYKYSLYGLVVR